MVNFYQLLKYTLLNCIKMDPIFYTLHVYYCVNLIKAGDVSVETSYVREETSTQRLTILHARLHEEADKIRKWKTYVDFEMKSKVTDFAHTVIPHVQSAPGNIPHPAFQR